MRIKEKFPVLWSATQVAAAANCHRSHVYRLVAAGRLAAPVPVGVGRVAWRADDVAEFLKNRGGAS